MQDIQVLNQLFVHATKVLIKNSPQRSRGVFANKLLKRNELCFESFPVVTWSKTHDKNLCTLCLGKPKSRKSCEICQDEPELIKSMESFHNVLMKEDIINPYFGMTMKLAHRICLESRNSYENTKLILEVMNHPVIDEKKTVEYEALENILEQKVGSFGLRTEISELLMDIEWFPNVLNTLAWYTYKPSSDIIALFDSASFLNHSCQPNCQLSFSGGNAQVTALADIKPGNELFINYYDTNNQSSQENEKVESEISSMVTNSNGRDEIPLNITSESNGVVNTCSTSSNEDKKDNIQKIQNYLKLQYDFQCTSSSCTCGYKKKK